MFDRSNKPIPKKTIRFNLPLLKSFTLSNDLNVYFIQKNELPIIRISLILYCGSRVDPKGFNGLANLTAMCIDEGAGGLTAVDLADALEMLGTHISVNADTDTLQLSMQTLSNNFEPALKLFSAVAISPNLYEKEFDQQKRKILTTLLQLKDDPDYLADTLFEYNIFGTDHPYAYPTLGTQESISKVSLEGIKSFYKNNFSPNNSSVVIVGKINETELRSHLENHLGNWTTKSLNNLFNYKETKSNNNLIIVNKPGSVQTEIRVGYAVGKRNQDNYFQRLILNTILGGQFSSRINLNLREKHGYTYGAHSRISYHQHSGYFQVSTSVGIENSTNALTQIFKELNEIRNGVSQVEVDFAKDALTKRFPLSFETYGQISQNLKPLLLHNLDYSYFRKYVTAVNDVNKNDIEAEAISIIRPDEMSIVLVCDEEKIQKSELDKFKREIKTLKFDKLITD